MLEHCGSGATHKCVESVAGEVRRVQNEAGDMDKCMYKMSCQNTVRRKASRPTQAPCHETQGGHEARAPAGDARRTCVRWNMSSCNLCVAVNCVVARYITQSSHGTERPQ